MWRHETYLSQAVDVQGFAKAVARSTVHPGNSQRGADALSFGTTKQIDDELLIAGLLEDALSESLQLELQLASDGTHNLLGEVLDTKPAAVFNFSKAWFLDRGLFLRSLNKVASNLLHLVASCTA